ERAREERHRHVVHLHAALGRALELPAMRMAVKDHRDGIAADRLLEAARAEERMNLERLAFDGLKDGRVVQQRDEMLAAQARERGLELQGLINRFTNELLDDRLAPGRQRVAAEAAAEPLDARDADALQLACVAVEHVHAGI